MSGARDFTDMQRLYGRSVGERIDELIGSIDALASQVQTLRTNTTADGAERVAAQLHGMQRSMAELITALVRELKE